jgi:hypothetical protein
MTNPFHFDAVVDLLRRAGAATKDAAGGSGAHR